MTTDNDLTPSATTSRRRGNPIATTPAAMAGPSKSDTVIKLLLRAKGATPLELIAATDWQPHSVRAFLSGLRKKGRSITREARKSGEFAYRIVTAPAPSVSAAIAGQTDQPVTAAAGTGTTADASVA